MNRGTRVEKKNNTVIIYIVLALAPLLGAALLLLKYRIGFGELSFFNSPWNDELSYYKQIEGVINYGIPKGYFGYNESRAAIGTFGPWSPILLLPYAVVGRIIGLGFYQIFAFNLLICSLTIVGISFFLKLNWKAAAAIAGLFALNANTIRYTMSISPEIVIMICALWMFAFLYKYEECQEERYINGFMILMICLTLARGYYAIFCLTGIFVVRNGRKKVIIFISAMLSAVLYLGIVHFFCSPYFRPLINMELIELLWKSPMAFVTSSVDIIINGFKRMPDFINEMVKFGSFGAVYYILSGAVIVISLLAGLVKRSKTIILSVINFVLMVMAIWLLYDVETAIRHLMGLVLALSAVSFIILAKSSGAAQVFTIILLVSTFFLTFFGETDFVIRPPQADGLLESDIDNTAFDIEYAKDGWENTVIWSISCDYRYLYALPKGAGINLCTEDYIYENAGNLRSKYIAINSDNEGLKKAALDNEWTNVEEIGAVSIYATR